MADRSEESFSRSRPKPQFQEYVRPTLGRGEQEGRLAAGRYYCLIRRTARSERAQIRILFSKSLSSSVRRFLNPHTNQGGREPKDNSSFVE